VNSFQPQPEAVERARTEQYHGICPRPTSTKSQPEASARDQQCPRSRVGLRCRTHAIGFTRFCRRSVMNDPIAFFITWPTYGTWLPGDPRGWVQYQKGWQLPDPDRALDCRVSMTDDACHLGEAARQLVENQIAETCRHRGWSLFAVNCRRTHLHVIIGAADTDPGRIRRDLKSWCTRRLKECVDPHREQWWAERGSIRWIFDDDNLETAILYVRDAQDRKDRDR